MARLKLNIVRCTLALLLVVAAGTGLLLGLRQELPQPSVELLNPGVDVLLQDIRFSEHRGGSRKYLLQAERATFGAAAGRLAVENIEVEFFDRAGRETMRLRADAGELSTSARQVNVHGSVVLTGTRGFVLETDQIVYNKDEELLSTDSEVRLRSPQGRLRGRGLRLNPPQGRVTLLHDVHGEFNGPLAEDAGKRGV